MRTLSCGGGSGRSKGAMQAHAFLSMPCMAQQSPPTVQDHPPCGWWNLKLSILASTLAGLGMDVWACDHCHSCLFLPSLPYQHNIHACYRQHLPSFTRRLLNAFMQARTPYPSLHRPPFVQCAHPETHPEPHTQWLNSRSLGGKSPPSLVRRIAHRPSPSRAASRRSPTA